MKGKQKFLINLTYYGSVVILVVLLFRYVVPILLPFLFGFGVASIWNPLITKIATKRKRGFATAIVIFPFWGILLFLLWKLGALLYGEAVELLNWAQDTDFEQFVGTVELPFLKRETLDWITARLDSFLPTLMSVVQSAVRGLLDLLLALPQALIFSFTTVLSSFLFAVSYPKAEPFLLKQLPIRFQSDYFDVKEFLTRKIFRIFRAYGIMLCVNYAVLAVGFWIIDVSYPLILAAIIAVFDLLPYVGIPSALIPWGIWQWGIASDTKTAIGLIVLAVILFIMRELLEPRIVGKTIGLSALMSLFSIYLGMKLLGFFGVIIFPLLFLLIKEWNDSGRILLWKSNPDDL